MVILFNELKTNIVALVTIVFKPYVEDSYINFIFAYEYALELLKSAKIRANLANSIPALLDRITINPNKMNGQPCIRDLRLIVWRVMELLQTYPD